jgi:hypothetical protein
VEFKHDGSVERASRLKFAGGNVHIYSLALNPGLFNQVHKVNEPSDNHLKPVVSHHSAKDQPQDTTSPSAHTIPAPPERRLSDASLFRTPEILHSLKEPVPPSDNSHRGLSSIPTSRLASPYQKTAKAPVRSSSLGTIPCHPAPGSPISLFPQVGTGPFSSLEKRLEMSLCGERITYDLEGLGDDPSVIIHLLKATSSERGNWMTVSGQYRRNGNPTAALTVTTELIKGNRHP